MTMTTQPKHTPTPWIDDACLDAQGFVTIRRADGIEHGDTETAVIATVYDADTAAFIVRVCNAHAGLLGALKGMLDMVRFADQDHDGFACGIALEQSQIIAARAAIAKAEGR